MSFVYLHGKHISHWMLTANSLRDLQHDWRCCVAIMCYHYNVLPRNLINGLCTVIVRWPNNSQICGYNRQCTVREGILLVTRIVSDRIPRDIRLVEVVFGRGSNIPSHTWKFLCLNTLFHIFHDFIGNMLFFPNKIVKYTSLSILLRGTRSEK